MPIGYESHDWFELKATVCQFQPEVGAQLSQVVPSEQGNNRLHLTHYPYGDVICHQGQWRFPSSCIESLERPAGLSYSALPLGLVLTQGVEQFIQQDPVRIMEEHQQLFQALNQVRRISPYVVATLIHVLSIAIGHSPGFRPQIDDELAPIRQIQKALVDGYTSSYLPTLMGPYPLTEDRPVYYSCYLPTFAQTTSEVRPRSYLDDKYYYPTLDFL